MSNLFIDCETCGLHGICVTIQFAYDDGPIEIFHVWKHKIKDTLEFIEEMCKHTIVGFNLAFDWFHIQKLYNVFSALRQPDSWPEDHIDDLAMLEPEARLGQCVKPYSALDLFLYARKGPLQSTMDRKDITIRKVPTVLAYDLMEILEKKIKLDEIYFARRKDIYAPKWSVRDIKGAKTNDFKEIKLSFKASSSLKALALHVLKVKDDILHFSDVEVEKRYLPIEYGFAPFALSISTRESGWWGHVIKNRKKIFGRTWPALVKQHINNWYYNELAQKYAKADVDYTRQLYHHFGKPDTDDDDSVLACAVASVRWKGYHIHVEKLKELREKALGLSTKYPIAPRQARRYITETLSEPERIVLDRVGGSTKKTVLEELATRIESCPLCSGKGCSICDKGTIQTETSIRARNVLDARSAKKEVELYDKLIMAGRFHASFIVIGALSSRMSGTDQLNPQGIKRTTEVRSCFDMADEGYIPCGGDFAGFETVLAEAAYNDPDLRKDLTTCDKCGGEMVPDNGPPKCIVCGSMDGKKIHALFGQFVFPNLGYKGIKASKGSKVMDYYERSKRGVFALIYGGNAQTLKNKIGVNLEDAEKAEKEFMRRYKGVARARQRIIDAFCSMRQPGGLGTKVEWHEPKDKIESLFGFPRYFTLENKICKALFDLGNHPPPSWREVRLKVVRRDRIQTAGGAVQSALYGAAFGIQGSCMRAGANHEIQSSGAQITKRVQRKVWDIQPEGINNWRIQPCNIHDEVLCPTLPEYVAEVTKVVHETVETFRAKVPLIMMEWSENMESWASK